MKPGETKQIYEQACKSKRVAPEADEGRKWHRVLREFDARDVEAALDAWWGDTSPTQTGRPRGAFLPEPVELKPLIKSAHAKREAKARQPQGFVDLKCEGCGLVSNTWSLPGAKVIVKCRRCGALVTGVAEAA